LCVGCQKKSVKETRLVGLGVLGDGLGALGHGVLGELAREEEAHGGLDLAGGDGALLVVAGEPGGLTGETLKEVVDEGVHDGHGLGGDTGVRVHLLEHLVDVGGVGLLALGAAGALATLGGLAGSLALGRGLGHVGKKWVSEIVFVFRKSGK
jgi:hypothetical protein